MWEGEGDVDANVLALRYEADIGIRRACSTSALCVRGMCGAFSALRCPDCLREMRRDHLNEPALTFCKRRSGVQRDRADERFTRDERNAQCVLQRQSRHRLIPEVERRLG